MHHSHLKCFICVVLSVVALWLMALSNLTAQTTEGKEFWLVFQKNFRDSVADERTDEMHPAEPLKLHVTITAREDAKGYIECPSLKLYQPFTVKGGEISTIQLDAALQVISTEVVEKKGLHIVSDVPITVYGGSHRYQTTDTYLALPVESLGLTYRAMGYKWLADDLLSQFAVVAAEDNTTVTITPSIKTRGRKPAGTPFAVQLNKGEVYQVIPLFDPTKEGDLTGSLITSDKPVALFSGHNCAYVPERTWKACNILVEQLPPVDSWGTEFVVGPFTGRSSSVIRVVAHQDGTEVFENGKKVATLSAGQFYENPMVIDPTVVTAGKPVLLTQFAKGFTAKNTKDHVAADSIGDPMMIALPPTNQYLDSYRFATPYSGSWNHYVTVTTTREGMKNIKLDGKRIPPESFTVIPESDYVVAGLSIEEGSHVLEGKRDFGLYSYGFGIADKIYDAYGNNCGQGLMQWVAERPKEPSISQTSKEEKMKQQTSEEKANDEAKEITPTAKEEKNAPTTTLPTAPQIPSKNPPTLNSSEINNGKPKIESREE